MDLNVEAAWAQGVTGKNVTTAIMDDGNIIISRVLYLLLENFIFIFITTRGNISIVSVE